ncbi:hypothetical protein [uncultured Tateyamaria sp.]|uniref:hypothetical protein n=1 Tax=uncultured Tateyamaria sp. TaxID=455651 RepID=UPI00260FCF21|nr:hypothetical protein [uncultured Tateyamaria sp.]
MDPANTTCHATPVTPDEFDQAISCVTRAKAVAAHIIADARAALEVQETDLAARVAEFEERRYKVEETEFRAAVDQETIAAHAAEAVAVMGHAARFQDEVVAVTPWLVDLVETCLRRIVGQLDPAEVLAATVAVAVAELKSRNALSLRFAATDHTTVADLVAAHPAHFAAVAEVVPDAGLSEGTVHLEGRGGFVEIGIAAQIEAIRSELERLSDQSVATQ